MGLPASSSWGYCFFSWSAVPCVPRMGGRTVLDNGTLYKPAEKKTTNKTINTREKYYGIAFNFFLRTNGSFFIAVGYNESISVAWCKARSLSTLAWLLHSQSGKVKLRNNLQISASSSTPKVRTTLNNYIIHSGTEGNYKQIWETDAHKKISIQ